MHLLEMLTSKESPEAALPDAVAYLQKRIRALHQGDIGLSELLVRQRLGRKLEAYRTPSAAARAVMQLKAAGKELRPGQRVPFLYTLGKPGVFAWDRPQKPNPRSVDVARYQRLLLRAASIVLEAWGLDEETLTEKVHTDLSQLCLPIPPKQHPGKHRRNIPGVVNPAVNRALKG